MSLGLDAAEVFLVVSFNTLIVKPINILNINMQAEAKDMIRFHRSFTFFVLIAFIDCFSALIKVKPVFLIRSQCN